MPVFDFSDNAAYGGSIMSKNFDENVTDEGWVQKGGGTAGHAIKLQMPQHTATNSFYVVSFRMPEFPYPYMRGLFLSFSLLRGPYGLSGLFFSISP